MLAQQLGVPRQVCWLAQQAADKALKAVLIDLGIEFPRTHDLDVLRTLLPADSPVKDHLPDLAELGEWAVEARYPGDWPEATRDDATLAVSLGGQVVLAAASHLAAKGLRWGDL